MHKLEFLALKWAVVDKLHDNLYGATFVVKTDNNSLTYLLSTAKLYATGHQCLAALSEFQFSLKYRCVDVPVWETETLMVKKQE